MCSEMKWDEGGGMEMVFFFDYLSKGGRRGSGHERRKTGRRVARGRYTYLTQILPFRLYFFPPSLSAFIPLPFIYVYPEIYIQIFI